MSHSEQINELAKALATAQGQIGGAVKGKENPFFKSRYADLPAVMDACRIPLSKNGIAVIQSMQFDGDASWIETMLAHASGQWVMSRYPLRPTKSDPQSMGSCVSYARRYALMAMVGIVAEDEDDDGHKASDRGTVSPYSAGPTKQTNGNGSPDTRLTVGQWKTSAIATIKSLKTHRDLNAWEDANKVELDRLNSTSRTAWEDIITALSDQAEKLNPLNAG